MSDVELVGPITYHAVVVHGRKVPYLTATPVNGGSVEIMLDNRFTLDVPVADLDRVVGFIADCIAVGMGYTAHPRPGWDGPVPAQPMPRWTSLDLGPVAGA